jgi:hypothetical protein
MLLHFDRTLHPTLLCRLFFFSLGNPFFNDFYDYILRKQTNNRHTTTDSRCRYDAMSCILTIFK